MIGYFQNIPKFPEKYRNLPNNLYLKREKILPEETEFLVEIGA